METKFVVVISHNTFNLFLCFLDFVLPTIKVDFTEIP
jgi:hypothetical protein